jgi:uncharacterized protein YjbJ (UPF0337 family)
MSGDDIRRRAYHRSDCGLILRGEAPMNKDQITGKIDQAVGKVKQSVGEAVGNDELANRGVIDQAKGAVKETWGSAKEAAQEVNNSHKEVDGGKADRTRDNISQTIDDAKDKLKGKIEEFKDRHSA